VTLLVETDSGDDESCEEAAGHSSTCRRTEKHQVSLIVTEGGVNCKVIAATSGDQMYSLQNIPNRAAKVVFAREDMSMLDHSLRHFTGCQSKTGLFLR